MLPARVFDIAAPEWSLASPWLVARLIVLDWRWQLEHLAAVARELTFQLALAAGSPRLALATGARLAQARASQAQELYEQIYESLNNYKKYKIMNRKSEISDLWITLTEIANTNTR